MTTTSTLPPPLSAPPTVGTLQGLLDGLQQPMQRGVPSPPAPGRVFEEAAEPAAAPVPAARPAVTLGDASVLDLTRMEQLAASQQAPVARPATAPPVGARALTGSSTPSASTPAAPMLTWSAGRVRNHRRAAALTVVAVTGTVAALVATGELPLP